MPRLGEPIGVKECSCRGTQGPSSPNCIAVRAGVCSCGPMRPDSTPPARPPVLAGRSFAVRGPIRRSAFSVRISPGLGGARLAGHRHQPVRPRLPSPAGRCGSKIVPPPLALGSRRHAPLHAHGLGLLNCLTARLAVVGQHGIRLPQLRRVRLQPRHQLPLGSRTLGDCLTHDQPAALRIDARLRVVDLLEFGRPVPAHPPGVGIRQIAQPLRLRLRIPVRGIGRATRAALSLMRRPVPLACRPFRIRPDLRLASKRSRAVCSISCRSFRIAVSRDSFCATAVPL